MRGLVWGLVAFLCGCHARLANAPTDGTVGDSPDSDATDAPTDAIVLGAWGTPQPLPVAATGAAEDDCTMSSDTLELYWAIADTNGNKDLYVATRGSMSAPFGTAQKLGFDISGTVSDETPRLSADDLTLYFASNRTGGKGNLDIWSVHRNAVGQPWGTPVNLAEVNSTANEKWFMPCGTTGHYMVIVATGATNGNDLFEGTLGGGAPTVQTPLNSTSSETGTFLTQDCLTIFYASARGATDDLLTAHRAAVTDPWPPPTVVTDFGTADDEQDPWMSADQRTFVFASNAGGNYDIYMSTR